MAKLVSFSQHLGKFTYFEGAESSRYEKAGKLRETKNRIRGMVTIFHSIETDLSFPLKKFLDFRRSTAQPESLEIAEYQLDMQRTLNDEYKKAERIVDKRKDKTGQLEYYVKWRGLPYVECSWEAADLMERYFMTEILAFEERQSSKKLPMSVPSVCFAL